MKYWISLLLCLFIAGCAPTGVRRAGEEPSQPAAAPGVGLAVVVVTRPVPDLTPWLGLLETQKNLKLTLAVPHLQLGQLNPEVKKKIAAFVSEGRLEMALRLSGDPILPLLENTQNAAKSLPENASLPKTPFAWPEDVQAQVYQARSLFKQYLGVSPSGLVPGGGSISEYVLSTAKKANLSWVLAGQPALWKAEKEGLYQGPVAVLVASPLSPKDTQGAAADEAARKVLTDMVPGVTAIVILEEDFLRYSRDGGVSLVQALASKAPPKSFAFVTPSEVASLDAPALPAAGMIPSSWGGSLAPWIGEPEENRAWELLAQAREDANRYKNSGQADPKTLGLIMNTLYTAEYGTPFRIFGHDTTSSQDETVELSFRASLRTVYQLMGGRVPEAMESSLARERAQGTETDGAPRKSSSLTTGDRFARWTDPAQDDRGPGDYFYPSGNIYTPGSWDLTSFQVSYNDTNVVFTFKLGSLDNPWAGPAGFSLPLIDVYMDLNHFAGRGATDLLSERAGYVSASDAWEYALVIQGWGARLVRSAPGGKAQKVLDARIKSDRNSKEIQVTVPKSALGKNPLSWGYLVLVMGHDRTSPDMGEPLAVAAEPDSLHFGGAPAGKTAPPILDVLTPPGTSQEDLLSAYKTGSAVVLPMVRVD